MDQIAEMIASLDSIDANQQKLAFFVLGHADSAERASHQPADPAGILASVHAVAPALHRSTADTQFRHLVAAGLAPAFLELPTVHGHKTNGIFSFDAAIMASVLVKNPTASPHRSSLSRALTYIGHLREGH